jgi:hypothetical protein
MTQDDFLALCAERTIDPAIALESEKVRQAIRLDDIYWLIAILDNDF